jgi:hypothetical protein
MAAEGDSGLRGVGAEVNRPHPAKLPTISSTAMARC